VDEGIQLVLLNGYKALAGFLAEVVDGRFWHDWFHDTVIVGGWNWLSRTALDGAVDRRGIDAFANGLGAATRWLAGSLRRLQNGFVRSYALAVMLGVVLILGYLLLK
jgi:NADH-quinone oxidoreductase subunit L